jgi:hypothetical protein
MGNLKKLYGQQANCSGIQMDFLSFIREFPGGKLKQKAFFHSVLMNPLEPWDSNRRTDCTFFKKFDFL